MVSARTPKPGIDWKDFRSPFKLIRLLWPKLVLYNKQEQLVDSVWRNDKTICVAGNMLGKDFTAGLIALTFFLTRTPCRIVTTSVDETQLEGVLWGEIRRLIQSSTVPLDSSKGGPLLINHLHLRKVYTDGPMKGQVDGLSYCLGRVAKKGEGLLGHHIADVGDGVPRTLFIADEASGVEDVSYDRAETWAKRQLYIGNPYECSNAFYRESEAGDQLDPDTTSLPEEQRRYYRKVVRITGYDSPNVRFAEAHERKYGKPTNRMLIPGVLPYYELKKRLKTWDPIRISISIGAQFYKGSQVLLFPPLWLDKAHEFARTLKQKKVRRIARAIGVDPGEGEAETAWVVVDEYGIIEVFACRTPNTSDISKHTLALMRKHNVPPEMVMFDRGGGGLQIADQMRDNGYYVRTVGFGESVAPMPRRGMTSLEKQVEQREDRYTYVNRRAEMYGRASILLDPSNYEEANTGIQGFAVPDAQYELRRQLALIPKRYDKEGRLFLPPKNKKDPTSKEKTLIEIIGCSPDRADAFVIALYCRDFATKKVTAGAA